MLLLLCDGCLLFKMTIVNLKRREISRTGSMVCARSPEMVVLVMGLVYNQDDGAGSFSTSSGTTWKRSPTIP